MRCIVCGKKGDWKKTIDDKRYCYSDSPSCDECHKLWLDGRFSALEERIRAKLIGGSGKKEIKNEVGA